MEILIPFIGCLEIQSNIIKCLDYAVAYYDLDQPSGTQQRNNKRRKLSWMEQNNSNNSSNSNSNSNSILGGIFCPSDNRASLLNVLLNVAQQLHLNFQQGTQHILQSVVSLDTIIRVTLPYKKQNELLVTLNTWMKDIITERLGEQVTTVYLMFIYLDSI